MDDDPPKGKKSKADKEKLKKEAEELKAKEEEEARLLAEQEERDRKDREKVEAEETRRLENEERKRRKGQLEELESIWMGHVQQLADEMAVFRTNAKWARYMRCDGSPDPTIQGEINTYINLWRESKEDVDIDSVLKESDLTLSLIKELMDLIEETPEEEMMPGEIKQHQDMVNSYNFQTMVALQTLLKEKLDLASHHLLLQSSAKADAETMNLQQVISNELITLCMWGNLSKNPRIKSHEFEKKGFTFEMPKLLTLSDIGFRVLFTKYDHHSPHCKTYLPRVKAKPIEEMPESEEETKDEAAEEVKPEGEEDGEKADGEGSQAGDGLDKEETNFSLDVDAALRGLDEDGDEEPKEEEPQEEAVPLEEDYEIKTPEPLEFDDFDGDDDAIDLRAYHILGGVFYFDLLHLPPQPKNVKNWVITQIVDPPELNYYDYVSDFEIAPAEEPEEGEEKEGEDKEKEKKEKEKEKKEEEKKLERPPICVVMNLPEDVYFCEEPQVVRWDSEKKFWRVDGFHGHNFDEEKRLLAFKTNYFGTMALIQDAHINMPFQSWEIRPKGLNHAQLTIIAAIVEIEIQIKNDVVCLSQPEERSELKHLINQWMSPKELIKKLKLAGVNVFPDIDSNKYVSTQNKDDEEGPVLKAPNVIAERRFYQQMAMVASSMAFSWSKWNNENEDAEKIVVQGTEHLKDEPLLEDEWALFMITKKRTTKLKCTEFDEVFAEEHAEGTEFHADMYHMYLDICGEEGRSRVLSSNYRFIINVFKLLDATKVITYS